MYGVFMCVWWDDEHKSALNLKKNSNSSRCQLNPKNPLARAPPPLCFNTFDGRWGRGLGDEEVIKRLEVVRSMCLLSGDIMGYHILLVAG